MKRAIYAYPELSCVCVDITATRREKRHFPNPLFMPMELTPGQARYMARKLLKAADALDQWEKDVEEYFATHPTAVRQGQTSKPQDGPAAD